MPTAPRVTQPDSELAVDEIPAAHAPSERPARWKSSPPWVRRAARQAITSSAPR